MAPLKPVPESGPLVEKKSIDGAVSVTRVTKSEEAVFNLKTGKDAIVRLAAALQPFAPVFDFVSEGLQWKSTRKAMTLQAAFCFFVIYSYFIIPGILVTLGLCTLTNKKEDAAGAAGGGGGGGEEEEGGRKKPKHASTYKARAKQIDVAWVQRCLEKIAMQLEHATAVTMWEDPIVTTAFIVAMGAATVVLMYVPFQLVVLAVGLYHMRPPSWRVVPGPVQNLLNRMPDKSEEYTRLMEEVSRGGGHGAASGA